MSSLYSHSRLSCFENCKKQFHFRYVLKIPQESEGIEAFVGKRVHEVLERLYLFVAREQVPALGQVIQRYHALWDEGYDAARIRIVKSGTSREYYRELGSHCLSNFYRRHYPFDQDQTLGLEQRIVFALDDAGRYRLQGIIDRVVRARDGAVEIHDYKTGRYVPSQKRLDQDRQLALYQIGLGGQYGDEQPMRLVWHYLAKGQTRTSARSSEQLLALRQETVELIDRIEEEREFPATRNNLCAWCEYKDICPEWSQDAAVQQWRPVPLATEPGAEREERSPDSPERAKDKQLDLL